MNVQYCYTYNTVSYCPKLWLKKINKSTQTINIHSLQLLGTKIQTTTKPSYRKALPNHGLTMFYSWRIHVSFKIPAVLKKFFRVEWMWKWIITENPLTMDYQHSPPHSYTLGIINYYSFMYVISLGKGRRIKLLSQRNLPLTHLFIWSPPLPWACLDLRN